MSKLVVYLSLTGNIRNFVNRLGIDNIELNQVNPCIEVNQDYVLIVPTYSDTVTDLICDFIDYKNNVKHLIGVIGSGDKNFNRKYIFSAKDISKMYKKPIIFDFEKSGTSLDLKKFREEVGKY